MDRPKRKPNGSVSSSNRSGTGRSSRKIRAVHPVPHAHITHEPDLRKVEEGVKEDSTTTATSTNSDTSYRTGRLLQIGIGVIECMGIAALIVIVALFATDVIPIDNKNETQEMFHELFEGTDQCQLSRLVPQTLEKEMHFGSSVSLGDQGKTAIVGAYSHDTGMGDVYVFERQDDNSWRQESSLFANHGGEGDFVGSNLALDGESFIVGLPNDYRRGDWSGSAFIYGRSHGGRFPWTLEAELQPIEIHEGDYFGQSVALSKDTAIVGAQCDVFGRKSGAAYIFTRPYAGSTYWTEEAKLLPVGGEEGAANDEFGKAVAIDGDISVIGAWLDADHDNLSVGSAYVFRRSYSGKWEFEDRLLPPYGKRDGTFGHAVAIEGNYIVVGAPGNTFYPESHGTAYVFHFHGGKWNMEAELRVPPRLQRSIHYFGHSVALSKNVITISSWDSEIERPSIDIYIREGRWWNLQEEIYPKDSNQEILGFASAVDVDHGVVLVGARYQDMDNITHVGAAYVFECEGI